MRSDEGWVEVQWRCGLGAWATFSPLARSGAGVGRQQKSGEGRPVHCCRCVGPCALPAVTVVWCPCVSLSTLGHCCRLLEAVWKSAGSVARLVSKSGAFRVGCSTPGCSDSCVPERTNPILTPFSRSSHFSGLPLPRPLSWELISLSVWGQSYWALYCPLGSGSP